MTMALPKGSIVAVVGSGAMGSGIAQVAAAAGHQVRVYDTRPEAVSKAIADIAKAYAKLVEKGRMGAAEADLARERIQPAASLGDLSDAALVVEAIVENLDVKRKLFTDLEAIVRDNCILATNTSSISITSIAAPLRRPERLVGMHFFNPVPLMALVEVISGLATSREIADIVFATAESWGKEPVHAKSTPGFIVNRVARPYYAEALRLLLEGAADPATIDAIMRDCGGFRMGPFELMDLIGHDVNFSVTQSVFNAYFGDPRFTPSIVQQELVNAGFLGRKTGRGFYDYAEGAAKPAPKVEHMRPPLGAPEVWMTVPPDSTGAPTEPMEQRFKEHGIHVVRDQPQQDYPAIAAGFHCNGVSIFPTNGQTATAFARSSGCNDTVLYDLLLDTGSAKRIALARADGCRDTAYDMAVTLFQAAGFEVTPIDDVAGMVVMRTVAMLANEAADAVNQGVCSAAAVDTAMRKGVNYPRGPLAWTDSIGIGRVCAALEALATTYGEDRYRLSPLLRRKRLSGAKFHAQ
jgi:3-hydroxybutyryl-CoA dehydrogenase